MKPKLILPTITAGLALALTGCVTPPSPTIGSLGAGSDSAYLNANRGRADAQMSRAQAEQYSRQRQQIAEEMQLEQMKRDNTTRNINNVLGIGLGVAGGVLRCF